MMNGSPGEEMFTTKTKQEKTIYPTVSEDVKSVPVGRIAF
jgi:hypothetical protein